MKTQPIYFDYAAATPVSDQALSAVEPFLQDEFYNPSALYLAAKDANQSLEKARQTVAVCVGVRPSEITFSAGGTEANNMAIHGVMQRFPDKKMLTSSIEHDSVSMHAAKYETSEVPVDAKGRLNIEKLRSMIDDDTVLVSIIMANNEIGTVQSIKDIASVVDDTRRDRQKRGLKTPIFLHTDACQAPNYLDIHVAKLGVDMMTLNSGKVYGPKQVGCLYVKAGIELAPLLSGGGQEHGLRSGTQNVSGAVGFSVALRESQAMRKEEAERLSKLQQYFFKQLGTLSDVTINGPTKKHRLPNNIHFTIEGKDNERLLMELDERGIQCATGSACSASKEESSHVLRAIGLSNDQARSSLRFSMGRGTKQPDIDRVIAALHELL